MGTTAERPAWAKDGDEKRRYVREMFTDIAPTYDLLNSLMTFRLHHRWRAAAVRAIELKPGDSALDLCTGTGDFLPQLRKAVGVGGTVVGLDFCHAMLAKAREKFGDGFHLGVGDACRLPLAGSCLDAVTVGWGLRNVPDVEAVLSEAARVLKPGGRFVTLDSARPRTKIVGRASEAVFQRCVPLLGRLFGKAEAYSYLPKSTAQCIGREDQKSALEAAGFADVQYRDFFFGNICMHWGTKR
ncbi:MAG: ubiquinone/menaquinone biosynthesis methyltransferase [Armatimonadetes bacterium]|nr:ubiquinone/menaquinone biosynthesis methyltransferase [Armatimonadota bacterium]